MFFNTNINSIIRDQSTRRARVTACGSFERYLGLPALAGKSKYNNFRSIKDRIWLEINNWKNNFLSKVGKEVMIKTFLQVIPTYPISEKSQLC